MTDDEWFRAVQSRLTRASARKARLFAVACCRRAWHLMTDDRHRAAVEAFERFADDLLSEDEFQVVLAPVIGLWRMLPPATSVEWDPVHYLTGATRHLVGTRDAADAANYAERGIARAAGVRGSQGWLAARNVERNAQGELMRDITGLTPSAALFDPVWRTDTAVLLARQMYESREFGAMPILADVLQDAGCDNTGILDHCRGPGPHVRGCWVVDLVLGKE